MKRKRLSQVRIGDHAINRYGQVFRVEMIQVFRVEDRLPGRSSRHYDISGTNIHTGWPACIVMPATYNRQPVTVQVEE